MQFLGRHGIPCLVSYFSTAVSIRLIENMEDPSHRQSAREGSSAADMQSNNNDTRSAVNGTQETPRAKGKRKANTPETPTPRKRPKLEKGLSCRGTT